MENETAVAFCFVGQFIRHATITRDVRRFGAARYHAFVASSLQHEEERTGDVVDSVALCEQLRAVGFSGCDALLEPYNASAYYQLTRPRLAEAARAAPAVLPARAVRRRAGARVRAAAQRRARRPRYAHARRAAAEAEVRERRRRGRRLVLHLLEREDVAGEDVAELRHGEEEVVWCAASRGVCCRARVEFARQSAVSCAADEERCCVFTAHGAPV